MNKALPILLVLAGCGSSSNLTAPTEDGGALLDGGASDARPSMTWSAACSSYALDYCNKMAACSSLDLVRRFGDKSTCEARTALDCAAKNDVAAGRTPSDVASCGNAWSVSKCGAFLQGVRPAACLLPGTVDNGGSCASDNDCKSTKCLRGTGGAGTPPQCGSCVAPAKKNEPCDYFASACGDGLQCPFSQGQSACSQANELMTEGQACGLTTDCEAHLYCKPGPTYTCARAAQLGDSCSNGGVECDIFDALWCSEGVCVRDTLKKPGEGDCSVRSPVPIYCTSGSTCQTNAGNTCDLLPEGASCGVDSRCAPPAACAGGKCEIVKASACVH